MTFVVLGSYIFLAPAAQQVLDVSSWHLPHWAMFHFASRGQYRVQFYLPRARSHEVIDRAEVLELTKEPAKARTITRVRDIKSQARQICRRLEAHDVRAQVARSTLEGWQEVDEFDRNLCGRSSR